MTSRAIFFDLDGTLEDSRADMVASATRVRAHFGLAPREYEDLVPHMSRGMPHLYDNCFDEIVVDDESVREVQRAFERDYLENICVETKLYPGIEQALAAASSRARLGVVTNKPEEHSVALLSHLKVAGFFDVVVGGDSADKPKPSPVPLRHAMRALSIPASESVMVGDSAGDIKMARAAGTKSIWCAWGYHPALGQHAPDMVAREPKSIDELLAAIWQ